MELTNTVFLVILAIASGGCLLSFELLRCAVGGKYLDQVCSLQRAQTIIADMTESQANRHLWVTTYLDTLFPVCYGLLLAGLALRYSPTNSLWHTSPAALAVLFDFMENLTHYIALKTEEVPKAKTLCSVLKWIFFALALLYPALLFLRAG